MNRLVGLFLGVFISYAAGASRESADTIRDFQSFVNTVKAEGSDNYIRPNIGPLLDLAPKAPTKAIVIEVVKEDKRMKLGRSCNVVKDSNIVVFLNATREKRKNTGLYFKSTSDGRLIAAIKTVSKVDETGEVIRGSGVKTDLKPSARKTKKLYAAELDFWLSGAYKKHLPSK